MRGTGWGAATVGPGSGAASVSQGLALPVLGGGSPSRGAGAPGLPLALGLPARQNSAGTIGSNLTRAESDPPMGVGVGGPGMWEPALPLPLPGQHAPPLPSRSTAAAAAPFPAASAVMSTGPGSGHVAAGGLWSSQAGPADAVGTLAPPGTESGGLAAGMQA